MNDLEQCYRRWFGISDPAPDFYQLLGIGTAETDPQRIRAAAESRLAILKSDSDPAFQELRRTVAEHVKTAYSTLIHSEQRAQYDRSLTGNRPLKLAQPLAPLPNSNLAEPKRAIPLAELPNVAEAVVEKRDLANVGNPMNASARIPVELQIRTRRQRAGRRSSWMWSLLGLLFFVGGPALILGLIWINWNSPRQLTDADQAPLENTSASANTPFQLPVPEANAAVSPDNSTAHPNRIPSNLDAASQSNAADPPKETLDPHNRTEPGQTEPDREASSPAVEANVSENSTNPQTHSDSESSEPWPQSYASPAVAQTARWMFLDLQYRQIASARQRLARLKNNTELPPHAQRQWQLLHSACDHAELFWNQVVQSCSRHRTGTELKMDAEPIGFIESTDQFVQFKIKGVITRAYFDNLPFEVAVSWAESGAIPDIPSWRLAKALAWMADPVRAAAAENEIRQLLIQSEVDGHAVDGLRWLLEQQLAARDSAVERMPYPDEPTRKLATSLLNERIPPRPIEQSNLAARYREIEQLLDLAATESDPPLRLAALERALKATERAADWHQCRVILHTIADTFQIDLEQKSIAHSQEMTRFVSTPLQAERLCDWVITLQGYGWPKFSPGMANPKQLVEADRLAKKHSIRAIQDRIAFLTQ